MRLPWAVQGLLFLVLAWAAFGPALEIWYGQATFPAPDAWSLWNTRESSM